MLHLLLAIAVADIPAPVSTIEWAAADAEIIVVGEITSIGELTGYGFPVTVRVAEVIRGDAMTSLELLAHSVALGDEVIIAAEHIDDSPWPRANHSVPTGLVANYVFTEGSTAYLADGSTLSAFESVRSAFAAERPVRAIPLFIEGPATSSFDGLPTSLIAPADARTRSWCVERAESPFASYRSTVAHAMGVFDDAHARALWMSLRSDPYHIDGVVDGLEYRLYEVRRSAWKAGGAIAPTGPFPVTLAQYRGEGEGTVQVPMDAQLAWSEGQLVFTALETTTAPSGEGERRVRLEHVVTPGQFKLLGEWPLVGDHVVDGPKTLPAVKTGKERLQLRLTVVQNGVVVTESLLLFPSQQGLNP